MYFLIILTALLPVAVFAFYIYRKDKLSPEPTSQLVKAFLFGVLSAPLSFCISIPLGWLGAYPEEVMDISGSIRTAFFGAAIPEEIAKFVMLTLCLRKNRYFDEKMDVIVYAVCISLGFAALENLMYLFSSPESFMSVGLQRAIFAIPGHFCFGILMGYYYSLARFYPKSSEKNRSLIILAPIIAHGVYDSILFIIDAAPALSGVLFIAFLFFCHKMWKYCSRRINEHLQRDREQ